MRRASGSGSGRAAFVTRAASAASAALRVLAHLVHADDPPVPDQLWIDTARVHFRGDVIVGKDLLEV